MSGWISIHRKIQDHWLWSEKPYSRGQAWIDLLLMANHKDNKFLLGNELMEVERGSFITSEYKLMDKWGWSKTKVRNFLKLLEDEKMLIKLSDRKKTTITIVNYNDYQVSGTTQKPLKDYEKTTKELREDYQETTKELLKNPNNNDNKDNNDNNENNTVCMYDENLKEIVNIYSDNIGQVLPVIGEQLKIISEEVPADLFKEAVLIAVDRNKRYINYIEGILRNWKDANINTLSDLQIFRREKEIEREKKQQDQKKQSYSNSAKKTRFHNFEQRTDNYSPDEINKKVEEIAQRRRQEYRERMKQRGDVSSEKL